MRNDLWWGDFVANYNDHSQTIDQMAAYYALSTRQIRRLVKEADGMGYEINWRPRSGKTNINISTGAYGNTETPVLPGPARHVLDQRPQNSTGELQTKDAKIALLERQLDDLRSGSKIHCHDWFGDRVRIGIISDTHIGSLDARQDLLDAAYDTFEREGIAHVYHCGDLLDGLNMYRGHEFEVRHHGADAQVEECIKSYPFREGIKTYFIDGNHDQSFYKKARVNTGRLIAANRDDMIYLGQDAATIEIGDGKNLIRLMLMHPSGGTAYAISWKSQKIVESFSGGQKPHILCLGHFHKSEMLPTHRNVCTIQAGCIQRQTPYMRTKPTPAHMGFWILDFTVNAPKLISRFKGEFFPAFEDAV